MIFRGLARSLWPVQRAGFVSRNLWKVGLGIAAAVLLTSRGATEAPNLPQLNGRVAAAQSVPCGPLPTGTVTWNAPSYILPVSPGNDPFPDPANPPCTSGVIVGPNTTLVIDAAANPVQISSSGAALNVAGGTLETVNTDANHIVTFQAAPDVASWDGINITASGVSKGNASLSFVSIQGALRSIQISSGATSSPADSHYGLTVRNSGIGFSYFDGIDAFDTPISVKGMNDGHTGTINNIGSIGISSQFTTSAPALPADALHVDGMTFGSSAPFGVSNCPANQPCYIGNEAISGKFVPHANQPVSIVNSSFYRAGNYGVKLESANQPTLTNNLFACNGLGAPTTGPNCSGSGPVYSAVFLNDATADLAQAQAPSPPPYRAGKVMGNHGYGNGLDAIAFNGTVTSPAMTWQNATNATSDTPNTHWLGYLLTGDLNMANATLTIPNDSVVKTLAGTINLTNSTLDASSGGGIKTFTSLRDPIGIASCPTVFAASCGPAVLPGGEWGGINLSGGSKATINKTNIFYAATGIRVAGGATSTAPGINYGLVVSNSTIGPTFSDGISATGTPLSVTNTNFQCVATGCQAPAAGDHGISADFTGSPALGNGLLLAGNTFHGSVNEAIKGMGLAGQVVDIENNTVDRAGTAGIQLIGADRPTLKQNTITNSGKGTPTYPAIYLNGVTRADFNSAITGNAGSRNGLDAIAFHGGSSSLTWQTVANSTSTGPLGYLLDGPLTVNGGLTLQQNDYVPSLGSINVTGGALTATGAVVTSLKDFTVNIPTCGSVFDQKLSGACPAATPGDWGGLTLDSSFASSLSGSEIRYAATGIAMGKPGIAAPLTLNGTNLRNMSLDGIATQSSLAVSGGAFSNLGGHAIAVDLTGVAAGATVSITGASISGTGSEGILARGLTGQAVRIDGTAVDHPRAAGISLAAADHLTLTNNTITNAPAGYPAIYLNGFTGKFIDKILGTKYIDGNKGAGNGLDALAFHGTVGDDLTWITARNGSTARPLGYLLDGDLNLAGTLQVGAGDIVKSSGALNLGHLRADDTSNAVQKVFTSLSDDVAGVAVCHPASVLLPGCAGAAAGDWAGINLASDGALVNGAIRYATTGINVSSGAAKTFGSSSYGLLVSRSRIDSTKFDAIDSLGTPASVTNSSINGAIHGISVDFTGGPSTAALRLSGNRFSNTGAEALVGQALAGHPVWITDNQVQNATTFGVRLVGADQLVLRNNNISGSGGGPGAGAARYPAIYLSQVTADFARNVRGNVGSGNGLDAVMMNGTSSGDLSWITPLATPPTRALGYLLDGSLTVQGTLTARAGDEIKSRGGPIIIKGGALQATGATFTSLTDVTGPAVSCPSAFATFCGAAPGDWGGLHITQDSSGKQATATITGGQINFAETAVSTDNGPTAASEPSIKLDGVAISRASKDGVNSLDTPIAIINLTIANVGSHGIIASFFSPANCPAGTCHRLTVTNSQITNAAKDGIVANGLGGQPVTITGTTVTNAGTYGIRLVGADLLTVTGNTINGSGTSAPRYPAVYLSGVSGEFQHAISGNAGAGNGLDALVFHGIANNGLTWLTPGLGSTLGYMLDGPLTVNGPFTSTGAIVKVLTGGIKVNGVLTSTDTAFTSMRESSSPLACNTVFVPSGCPSTVAASDYWGGINVDAVGTSTLTGGSISDAASGLTISSGEIDITGATLTKNSGYALSTAGTGTALVTCTGIHGNGGGILANGAATSIDNSDLYGNVTTTGKDLDGNGPSAASRVWWNGTGTAGAPGPTQYNAGTVTVDKPLPQQPPSIKAPLLSSVQFSSDNTNSVTPKFGKGTLTVTLTFDRTMNLNQPLAVNFSSALDGVPHPLMGTWAGTDKVTWVGHAPIDETSLTGQPGVNTLTVKNGLSCMRDGANVMAPEAATFNLDFSTATIAGIAGASHVGATHATLNDTINPNGWSLPSAPQRTDTYGFFQLRPDTDPAWGPIVIPADPTTLLGYQTIGHGNTAAAIALTTTTGLLPDTLYDYRAVAVDLNGISSGPTQQFTTTRVASKLVLAGNPTMTAGDSYPFSVTVQDTNGKTVEDYTGTVHFALQQADPGASALTDYTFKAFSSSTPSAAADNGTAAFAQTLTKALNQTIRATDTMTSSIGGTLAVTVNPAAATQLAFGQQPADTTAGVSIAPSVTVLVEDRFGNTETGDTGTEHPVTVSLTTGSPTATLGGTTTQADIGGVATFSDLSIHTANAGYALHAVATGLTSADSNAFKITPASGASLQVSGLSTGTAGVAQTVTVTAKDAFNNTFTAYSGTVHFSSGDAQAVLPANYTFLAADGGAHTFSSAVTLKTAGSDAVTATDTVTNTITGSQTVTVNPAAAAALTVSGMAPETAGGAETVTLTAIDAFNNTATGYTGTVHFSSSDSHAVLPTNYTFLAADNGVHSFASVTLETAGSDSVTATDTTTSTITGSETVTVSPGAAATLQLTGLSNSPAGTLQSLTVTAKDAFNNTATGYTGTAHFTSTDIQAVLPADYTYLAAENGAHTFSVRLVSAGLQTVTATDSLTTTITGSQTVSVSPAAAASLTISGLTTGTAGMVQSVTVTANDAYNNTATGYTGTVHFTSSDSQAGLPGDYAFVAGDSGSHAFTVTLKTAGSQTVTATDTVTTTITGSQTVSVGPAATASLTLSGLAATTAGTAQTATVTAKDTYHNITTGYTGTVHFTTSDSQAGLPGDYGFVAGDSGSHAFTVTLKTAGTQSVTVADTLTVSWTASQVGLTVTPAGAATLQVTGLAPATAGTAQTVTVTARDLYNNTATGYSGTVHFTSSDGQSAVPPDYTFVAGDNGSHGSFGVTLATAGSQSMTATDTLSPTITGSEATTIAAAGAASITVTGLSPATAGSVQSVTVTARDAYNNTATGYTGTVHFTSTDVQAVLPANYGFGAGDSGVHVFASGITLKTAGSQTVTATDTVTATITGSHTVAITPGSAATLMLTALATAVHGTPQTVTVTAVDAYGNAATGYTGTVHFTSTDAAATLPTDYTFTGPDSGSHSGFAVTLNTAGSQSVTATDTVTSTITGSQTVTIS